MMLCGISTLLDKLTAQILDTPTPYTGSTHLPLNVPSRPSNCFSHQPQEFVDLPLLLAAPFVAIRWIIVYAAQSVSPPPLRQCPVGGSWNCALYLIHALSPGYRCTRASAHGDTLTEKTHTVRVNTLAAKSRRSVNSNRKKIVSGWELFWAGVILFIYL